MFLAFTDLVEYILDKGWFSSTTDVSWIFPFWNNTSFFPVSIQILTMSVPNWSSTPAFCGPTSNHWSPSNFTYFRGHSICISQLSAHCIYCVVLPFISWVLISSPKIIKQVYYYYFFMFIHLRVRESKQGRSNVRGEQRIWSRLWADSREPNAGLKLTNYEIMTWAEVRSLTNVTTQVPLITQDY